MARPPRVVVPNGIYRVTARGNRHQLVFTDEQDYRQYIRFLRQVTKTHGWVCHSYCLTPDEVCLVVQTPVPNLSAGMQRLQTRYAQWFNRRHGFAGHLFDGRFRSALVELGQLIETVRQVAQTPVRLGLCRRATEWAWSGTASAARVRASSFRAIRITLRLFLISPRPALEHVARVVSGGSARPPP